MYFFAHITLYPHRSHKRSRRSTEEASPDTVAKVWLGSIRVVCRAWRSLEVFFRREWMLPFPVFSILVRGFTHFHTCCFSCVFCSKHSPDNGEQITTARREHAYPPADCPFLPRRPASAGSTMCVWQVRAVLLWLDAILEPAIDRLTTPPLSAAAACCMCVV